MADINERIANARREAEALKDRIRQRKEALNDTTRKYIFLKKSLFFVVIVEQEIFNIFSFI